MHGDLGAAYVVWRYAQRGSGTSTASPGSFSEAAVCWLLSAKWGQFGQCLGM